MKICNECLYCMSNLFLKFEADKVECAATKDELNRDPVSGYYKYKTCRETNPNGECDKYTPYQTIKLDGGEINIEGTFATDEEMANPYRKIKWDHRIKSWLNWLKRLIDGR
jgi:hypothetical protein